MITEQGMRMQQLSSAAIAKVSEKSNPERISVSLPLNTTLTYKGMFY
ncbi:MAG: hypothetical protein P8H25_06625 [Flavobacteriaceae bacterium]|nr:hypothetical protein [Flavobacteriaceae bacterium]